MVALWKGVYFVAETAKTAAKLIGNLIGRSATEVY